MKITTGDDYPDIMDSRLKGALDYVLDRIVNGPGGRSVADRARRSALLRRPTRMWELSRAEREGHRGGPGPDWSGAAGSPGDCHGGAFHGDAVRAGGETKGGRELPGDAREERRQDRGAVRSFQESPGEEGIGAGGYRIDEQQRCLEAPAGREQDRRRKVGRYRSVHQVCGHGLEEGSRPRGRTVDRKSTPGDLTALPAWPPAATVRGMDDPGTIE